MMADMQRLYKLIDQLLPEELEQLSRHIQQRRSTRTRENLGFGPLEPLLVDENITAIMVYGPKDVYVEVGGHLSRSNTVFDDDHHILRILGQILAPLGRRIDESAPYVTFRLPDGTRANAVIRPIALNGPALTLRKVPKHPLTLEDLIRFGNITAEIAEFLRACVIARIEILIVGRSGSGTTTLLNVLSRFIPSDERIITVEHAAELQLLQEHVVRLETRSPNVEGKGEVTMGDLARMALQMQPDRVVFSDLGIYDVNAYLDTASHANSLAIVRAETVDAALSFLEVGALRTNPNIGLEHVRKWIGSVIKLIVLQRRLRDGSRKTARIVEVTKLTPGSYELQPIFEFEQTSIEAGRILGRIRPTGYLPSFIPLLEDASIHLPPSLFGIGSSPS